MMRQFSAMHPLDQSYRPERHQAWIGFAIGLCGTCLIHGSLVLVAALVAWFGGGTPVASAQSQQQLVFVDTHPAAPPEPEPAPPEPELDPPEPEPPPERASPVPVPPLPQQPAPAESDAETGENEELAEVGETLTTEADVDTFSVVSGEGDRFAGGESARGGTSKSAVRGRGGGDEPDATWVPPPTPPSRPALPEVVRRPWPKNGSWNQCRFPDAAKQAGIDDGHVSIIVHVSEKGRPVSVDVLFESPNGYGFGDSARRCAMRRGYHPGRDASGRKVAAQTQSYKVRMLRDRRSGGL